MPLKQTININKLNINHVINVVVLFVAGLIALKMYQGQMKKLTKIDYTLDQQRKKNEALIHIGELKEKIETYKGAFKEKDSRQIISAITNLAKVSEIKIVSLRPETSKHVAGKRKEEQLHGKATFGLNIEADSYNRLGKFISKLENDSMAFIVESISISGKQVRGTRSITRPDKMDVDLIISKFFFKD